MRTRRNLLKTVGIGAIAAPFAGGLGATENTSQEGLQVAVAGYDYDRVKGIMDGRSGIKGANVSFHYEDIYSVNELAFGQEKPYEVSELGLIPYVNKFINNDFRDYTLIPIFISRVFRHRNIFIRSDSGIEKPEDLKGKRVGTPGYGMSANTWIRGLLKDQYGVEANDMLWIEPPNPPTRERCPVPAGVPSGQAANHPTFFPPTSHCSLVRPGWMSRSCY